jgi:dihydrofolate synthase/folylpolyglutamate synthase
MFALMEELGNPQNTYPIIHVAGTKGKGSVSALCASALQAGGYKVGLYTSPHLLDYCERIQVNGEPISHEFLIEMVEQIKPAVAKTPKLTTFEITTALGFLAFAKQGCNAAVIEVGLGGRLDATNIVTPKVSVITSLSYDHTAVLGDTLTKIAGEKAGIIKDGVPVVSSQQKDEALEVLNRVVKQKESKFILVGKDVTFEKVSSSLDGQNIRIENNLQSSTLDLQLPLLGEHQIENAAVAYAALKASGIELSDKAIQKGFSQVKWRARFEIVRHHPPVVIDSAHNRNSALRLRETLDEYYPNKSIIMIFCVLEDKDLTGMLKELKPRLDHVIATKADHPRAPSAESIAEQVKLVGISVEVITPVASALERALDMAGEEKLVLSAGSVAFAGEVIAAWQKTLTLPSPTGRGESRPDKKNSQSG